MKYIDNGHGIHYHSVENKTAAKEKKLQREKRKLHERENKLQKIKLQKIEDKTKNDESYVLKEKENLPKIKTATNTKVLKNVEKRKLIFQKICR